MKLDRALIRLELLLSEAKNIIIGKGKNMQKCTSLSTGIPNINFGTSGVLSKLAKHRYATATI